MWEDISEARTAEALEGSIEKWKGVALGKVEEHGWTNCPLCELFFEKRDCSGCPVYECTGFKGCNNTPYEQWVDAGFHGKTALTYKAVRIAVKEVQFLKSLRVKE